MLRSEQLGCRDNALILSIVLHIEIIEFALACSRVTDDILNGGLILGLLSFTYSCTILVLKSIFSQ